MFSSSISFFLFLAGAVLLVAEAFAPGAHLFVLGVALLSAGLVAWNDEVVFYLLRNDTSEHIVKLLVGGGASRDERGGFVDFLPT